MGLAGLRVECVALSPLGVRVVHLGTDDPEAARCLGCRRVSTSPKGCVITPPHDLACGGRPVVLAPQAVEDGRDQLEVARWFGVSWPTVQRALMPTSRHSWAWVRGGQGRWVRTDPWEIGFVSAW
ncbi:MAG: hypothetical protein M3O70_21160 [Actinomycetota bacterium]|nr:hypothetical protein [Actinomycetota bacterium]